MLEEVGGETGMLQLRRSSLCADQDRLAGARFALVVLNFALIAACCMMAVVFVFYYLYLYYY